MIPQSVVVVKWPKGWVAHIRYKDSKKDIDLSSGSRYLIHILIDKHFKGNKNETNSTGE
jgi:hypothetical protein